MRSAFAILLVLLLPFSSLALEAPQYSFDLQKLAESKTSFHFLRSFVDYFYLTIAQNNKTLGVTKHFSQYSGKCVGDAHPENFGFLFQNDGNPLFTMNDIDDFGPCPMAYDIFRLLTASYLVDSKLSAETLLNAYLFGLSRSEEHTSELQSH